MPLWSPLNVKVTLAHTSYICSSSCSVVEQLDILQKSLFERNHLIQRWEQILENVDMPTSMQSIDPEFQIA